MSSPDQHTEYVASEYGLDTAIRFHLSSRVFPYWDQQQITYALPALRRAIAKASKGQWDAKVRWLYQDGTSRAVTVRDLFEGLNLWGLEEA
jgi:hypothetical protein